MKQKLKQLAIALLALGAVLLPAAPAYAASGSISLSATKSNVPAGGNVIVAVYVNGGGNNVNAVQADLSYPASKLQYIGFSSSGSAFEIGAASGGGNGTASLSRGTTSTVNGSALFGTVTFKALVGSGSAAISVAGSSALVSDGNAVPFGSSGATVTFGAAATSGNSAAVTKAAAPPVPKDTTAPVVTNVKTTDVTPYGATVSWTTNEPADSTVDYGLDDKYGLGNSATQQVTAHSVKLSSGFLTPLTTIHYRVKSVDGAGNTGTGPDQTIQLPGVPVTFVVRGSDGKPQADVSVTLDGSTGTTDSDGRVVLRSGLGDKKVTTSYQGVTVQKPVTVTKSEKPLPPVQLDLSRKPLNSWMLLSIGLVVIVFILLSIDAVLFGSAIVRRMVGGKKRSKSEDTEPPAAPIVAKEEVKKTKKPLFARKPKAEKPTEPVAEPKEARVETSVAQPEPTNVQPVTVAEPVEEETYRDPAPVFAALGPDEEEDESVDVEPFTPPVAAPKPKPTAKKVTVLHETSDEPQADAADIAERLKKEPKTAPTLKPKKDEPVEPLGAANFKPLSDIKPHKVVKTAPPLS